MPTVSQTANAVEAIATVVSRLLPIVEKIPNSFGKWVPPIKAAVDAHQKLAAKIALVNAASNVMRGRFSAVSALMTGLNLSTLGASKKLAGLGAAGGLAAARLIRGLHSSRQAMSGLQQGALNTQHAVTRTGRAFSASFNLRNALAAVGAYRLISKAVGGVKEAFDLGNELNDLQSKTGIAADQMLILRRAAKDVGIDDVVPSVLKMQEALVSATKSGTGPAAQAFALLGTNVEDLVKKSPVDQIRAIGVALSKIKSPALRTSVTRDIFGKGGADLIPMLADPKALESAEKSVGRQAQILKANATIFAAVSNQLGHAGDKLRGFYVGVAEKIGPMMAVVAKRLDEIDLSGAGEKFGAGIRTAVDFLVGAFNDPQKLFGVAVAYLDAGLRAAANTLIAGIKLAGNLLGSGSFMSALGASFEAVGKILQGSLVKAFVYASSYLAAGVESALELLPESLGGKKSQAQRAQEQIGGLQQKNNELLKDAKHLQMFQRLSPTPERAAQLDEIKGKLHANLAQQGRLTPLTKDRSLAERASDVRHDSMISAISEAADQSIKEGKNDIGKAMSNLFSSAAGAINQVKVEDVMGAGARLSQATQSFGEVKSGGKRIVDKVVPAAGGVSRAGARLSSMSAALVPHLASGLVPRLGPQMHPRLAEVIANASSRLQTGHLSTGALTTGNLEGRAYGQSPLLGLGERRAFEDAAVAQGRPRAGTTPNAFDVVRAGDKQRRQQVEREKTREKSGVDLTNQKLDAIYGVMNNAWGDAGGD